MSEQKEVPLLTSGDCEQLMQGADAWRYEREINAIATGDAVVISRAELEAKDARIAYWVEQHGLRLEEVRAIERIATQRALEAAAEVCAEWDKAEECQTAIRAIAKELN